MFVLALTLFCQTNIVTYAEDTEALYNYEYQGESTETSKHHFTFQWWYKDAARESVRNRYHETQIFKLVNKSNAEEKISAYCSDFIMSIETAAKYRRINLEDSTYYNDAAASHIRGIMDNGYWHTWTDADLKAAETAANAWLASYDSSSFACEAYLPGDAEEEVDSISNLTRDEALTATQLAIWAFANTEGDDWWVKYYESHLPEGMSEPGEDVTYISSEMPNNIKAFRKYLIHQQGRKLEPENIVFTDDFFVETSATLTKQGEINYDVELGFYLSASVSEEDQLQISAALGEKLITKNLNENGLVPDENGCYHITFSDVTAEEAEAGISLSLSGKQMVNDVYFYEALPAEENDARETSQNLVGWANGSTPVSASAKIDVEIGTAKVKLKKYDSSIGESQPIEGAIFNLYAEMTDTEGNKKDVLLIEKLATDENGMIEVEGLLEGETYFFKEVSAPDGYIADTETKHYIVWSEDVVLVGNEPAPEVPENPEEPKKEEPENSEKEKVTITEKAAKTGDEAKLIPIAIMMGISIIMFRVFYKKRA